MTGPPSSALDAVDRADLRARVSRALQVFLSRQSDALRAVSADLQPVGTAATELVGGGKRLRAAFCYWGWRGAGGADSDGIVNAAASLELLHASALVHDDVMDASDLRRGRPAAHRRFAALHRSEGWHGDPEQFGTSAAILLGDLCLIWADEMLHTCGLPAEALVRAVPIYDEMRAELMAGQYLDLLEQASRGDSVERALTVARFKTARYTVERPLQFGGSLAGGNRELLDGYRRYGLPLGEAFQLRDDVLGVFGDPAVTGKPAGDDLREGKRTTLVVAALQRADADEAAVIRHYLGDPLLDADGVAELRSIFRSTGALNYVEILIRDRTDAAVSALASMHLADDTNDALQQLATAATMRSE